MASLMGKHQIAINTSSLVDGDSIASYLVSAAGTLLTHTTIGAKEHLDVLDSSSHLDSSAYATGVDFLSSMGVVDSNGNWVPLTLNASGQLPVAATLDEAGDYAEDSAHTTGDIGYFNLAVRRDTRTSGVDTDGDYASFNVNANGELYVHDTDVLAELVSANATLTSIDGHAAQIETDTTAILAELLDQGTTLDSILADTATIDSNLASLTKLEDAAHASGDAGIQALAVRKDANGSSAADGDYTSLLTNASGALKVDDTANGGILQQQVTVSSTAAQVPAANLAGRKSLMLQNTSSGRMWIGSATVTTSGATAGIELPANSFMELEVGAAVNVYAIKSGGGTLTLNVLELA